MAAPGEESILTNQMSTKKKEEPEDIIMEKLGLEHDRMDEKSLSVNIHTVKDPNTIMSDTETPTKPTKTEEPPKTQIQSRYETIRVSILKPSEYPIWKVRMTIFLEATDPEYLDRIKEGPHKPTKLAVAVAGEEQRPYQRRRVIILLKT
ncbi:hypothetical protein AgCh_001195 [Apium graveolens]